MTKQPFDIKSLLFDLILSCATLFLGEIISAVICIMWTQSREEGLGYSAIFAVPIGVTVFYLIRRRFNNKMTTIQITITTLTILALTYSWIIALDYLPDYFSYEAFYVVLLIACVTFVLTKHFTDKIILKRNSKGV